jgi:hypothetical protein
VEDAPGDLLLSGGGGCYVAVAVAPVIPDAVLEDLVNGLGAVRSRLTDVDSGVRVRVNAASLHVLSGRVVLPVVAVLWMMMSVARGLVCDTGTDRSAGT